MNEDKKMKILLLLVFTLTVGGVLIPHKKKEKDIVVKKENTKISVSLTGDLLWEQGLYDSMDNYQFGTYFDQVKPYLQSDLTIGNEEVPIGGEELGVSGVAYTFNAPYEIANQYKDVGFDFLTLANNHTMDMGLQGIQNTCDILDKNDIGHTGAYTSQEDRDTIRVVNVKDTKIAILSYTYGTNIPSDTDYAVPCFLDANQQLDKDTLKTDVDKAKKEADLIFVAMHWGTEFTYDITPIQEEAAKYLNELGVDVIIGNHTHTIQKATTITNDKGKNTYVFYSLGNLVSSAANVDRATPDFQNMYEIGAIVNFDIVNKDVTNVRIIPVVNQFEDGYTNFELIPFSSYTEDLAKKHYQRQLNDDFTKEWLSQQIHSVLDDSNFTIDM